MAFLVPDKIITEKIGNETITIKQKITPDGAVAAKDICSYVKKGQYVKPNAKLNNGTGVPKGITVHNTNDIKCSSGTNPAEQYARATYPNGNMNGVAVHYWVWKNEVWQQLSDNERGWHAADGSSRRKDHRGGQTGGNVDTISIECIESRSDAESEKTLAKLVAILCYRYNLDPAYDVYTHNYWMHGVDKMVNGARKNCPIYILNHWAAFLDSVKGYWNTLKNVKPATPSNVLYRVQTGAFSVKANADKLADKLKAAGFDTYIVKIGNLYKVQVGAYSVKTNAQAMEKKLKAAGYDAFITTSSGEGAQQAETKPTLKSLDEIAKEVIKGLWGNGAARKEKLSAAGYDYTAVQKKVNELLK